MNDHRPSATDAIIVFTDLQEGIINLGATNDPQRVRNGAGALADLATAFHIPVVMSSVPTTGGTVAPLLTEITARLAGASTLVRTTADAMDDEPFRAALEKSGRRIVIIAGVATEVAVRLTALSAKERGYHVIVAVDACSGLDARGESATFTHLSAAGIELSTVATIAAQLAGDFGSDLGQAAMRALRATLGAHGHEHHHDEGESR